MRPDNELLPAALIREADETGPASGFFFGCVALALILAGIAYEAEPIVFEQPDPVVRPISELAASPYQAYMNPPEYVGDGC